MSSLIVLASETTRELPASPVTFGLIAFGLLSFGLWLVLQWDRKN